MRSAGHGFSGRSIYLPNLVFEHARIRAGVSRISLNRFSVD